MKVTINDIDYEISLAGEHDILGWLRLDDGIEICEQKYTASSWEKPRRMVIVRQKNKGTPTSYGSNIKPVPR